jgi:hypothetical protein
MVKPSVPMMVKTDWKNLAEYAGGKNLKPLKKKHVKIISFERDGK